MTSVYGKIPSQADFVHIGLSDPVCHHFDRWLQQAIVHLQRVGLPFPEEPLSFIYRGHPHGNVAVGSLRLSRDSAGRSYPLAIFETLPLPLAVRCWEVLPVAFAPFLQGAEHLTENAYKLDIENLKCELRKLTGPNEAEILLSQRESAQKLLSRECVTLLQKLLGENQGEGDIEYAIHTFSTACTAVQGKSIDTAKTILACPASHEEERSFWLNFAKIMLHWKSAPPCALWSNSNDRRHFLLSLGSFTPPVLQYFQRPNLSSPHLWPLSTNNPSARVRALAAIPPHQKKTLSDPQATLREFMNLP